MLHEATLSLVGSGPQNPRGRSRKPGIYTHVSAAFWKHLRRLGLQDFPCGLGSWSKSRFDARTSRRRGQPGLGADPVRQEEAMLLGEESPEARMELLSDWHSPWALPPDCSPQDQHLREMAVLAPELIHGSNIFQVLRSLRIVDKGVSAVDEGLLQLEQLEELILSANHISRISSVNLPRMLKVLELCCNAVADLRDLCAQPPPELQHLGLGHNRLCDPLQDKYLTANFWPNLVSLDLSFNNFTDLLGLVSQLSSLQKLRVLVLQGNPLALIPTYRGFLVDSLPKLCILDDIRIGPDERHQFHGLARQPGEPLSEARVVVSVGEIKGVPDPSALQQLEAGSQAPVITYSYCVTYEFAEGEEIEDSSSTEVFPAAHVPHPSRGAQRCSGHGSAFTAPLVLSAADPVPGTGAPSSHDESGQGNGISEAALPPGPDSNTSRQALPRDPSLSLLRAFLCPCTAKVFVTPTKPWADTINCSYRREHTARDLVGLKSYLMSGTIISVMEEKVSVWQSWMKGERAAARKYSHEGEGKTEAAEGWDKQKKKEKARELRSDPPIRRTLGTGRVTLEALLATEDLVATVCDFGVPITEQPLQPPSLEGTVSSVSWGRAVRQGCQGWTSARPALQLAQASLPSIPQFSSP
uniref:Leucine rich repeat containing 43 n=1 Tax=Strix occidentalis caurina TaxID=311401 RepID=A0A8D0FGB0_STROC